MKFGKLITSSLIVALASSTALAQTGRQIQTSSPAIDNGDGTETDTFIDTFWDSRCAGNVDITVNSAFLPNDSNGGPTITAEEAAAAIDAGLKRWTDNPSSFIDMEVADVTPLLGILGGGGRFFDFTNQASFELPLAMFGLPPGVLAVSASTPLIADATFSVGDDIDFDGDSDVFDPAVEGSNTCQDIDGDGDIEYPAGDYKAGAILDNDVFFNNAIVWETTPTVTGGVDIDAVSTHEYGHSHGLTHSTINQFSVSDGRSATMIPALDSTDIAFEEAIRLPSVDDLAASAFIYPEGTSTEGPARASRGDIPFRRAFSIIEGTVSDADGNPILGAAVTAINSDGEIVAVTFSGEASSRTAITAGATVAVDIANGNFRLPVPAGDTYTLSIEALDGPVAPGSINGDTFALSMVDPQSYPEETLNVFESGTETFKQATALPITPRRAGRNFMTRPFRSDGNFIINEAQVIQNATGPTSFASIPIVFGSTTSFQFIEQFSRDDILAAIEGGDFVTGVDIETDVATNNGTAVFSSVEFMLGTTDAAGVVTLDSTLVLNTPLENIFGQETDTTPVDFVIPGLSTAVLEDALTANPDSDLYVVVNLDNIPAVTDAAGIILPLVRPDTMGPETGTSFFTTDGSPVATTAGVFTAPVNWGIGIRTATPTDAERTLANALASLR